MSKTKCKDCSGQGFTAEHGCSPMDDTGYDCAITCPIQAQCETCQATGFVTNNSQNTDCANNNKGEK